MNDIVLSNKTYKLEQDPYIYQLQDTPDPELFREMFPYTETPKVAFNYRAVKNPVYDRADGTYLQAA